MDFEDKIGEDGNPEGFFNSVGLDIFWQGSSNKSLHNGATIEDVINAAKHRLTFLQNTKFKNKHYENAIEYLNKALVCLEAIP